MVPFHRGLHSCSRILFIVILLWEGHLFAQSNHIAVSDSAYILLNNYDYERAITAYKDFLDKEMAEKDPDYSEVVEAMNNVGYCYNELQIKIEAADWYHQALDIATQHDVKEQYPLVYYNLAEFFRSIALLDKALENVRMCLYWDEQIGDTVGITMDLEKTGQIYYEKASYDTAVAYYLDALRMAESLGDSVLIASIFNSLANLHNRMGNIDMAIGYQNQAIDIIRRAGDFELLSSWLSSLGSFYHNIKEYQKAVMLFEEALDLSQKQNNVETSIVIYNNLGSSLYKLGRTDEALEILEKAIRLSKEKSLNAAYAASLSNLAKIYQAKKQYIQASNLWIESLKTTEHYENLADQSRASYEYLSALYEEMGDPAQALIYFKKYKNIEDSLFNIEKQEVMSRLQVGYETEKKDQQIALLDKENLLKELRINRSNIILGGLSSMTVIILLLAVTLIRQNKLKAQVQTINLEQRLLRTQMNPHFIFNSLANIQEYIWKKDPLNANEYLSKFSRLLRLILENSRQDFVPVSQEVSTIENYLSLQKLRYQDKLEYTLVVDEEIEEEDMMIPPMLIQPFIENSIKHGIKPKETTGHIDVSFRLNKDMIYIEVTDDGIGFQGSAEVKKEGREDHRSLAMTITRERLQMLRKKYRKEIKLEIGDLHDEGNRVIGARITFGIPYTTI